MWRTFLSVVRFGWTATAGNRLRPWRSPYLRWRMETYTGKPAASLRTSDFLQLAISDRHQLWRFSRWMGEISRMAEKDRAE